MEKGKSRLFLFCHRTVCTTQKKKRKKTSKETISFHLGSLTFLTNINVYSIVLNMHSYRWCLSLDHSIDYIITTGLFT